ncbi:hypothetical protein ACERK3_14775 [Phycisphaerales bacterium AB-hyl4]|uniref:Uncharacterized protein n=1 Tax=Natronomicrosphaera hydrolytica TaxID=3242702 RepID=A0ABV4U7G4_9BACT
MTIKAHKLKDHDFGDQWNQQVHHRWNYADMIADPHWRADWISFDGVVHHAASDRVYCGITSFAADIFKAFDRTTGTFIDLGFDAVVDQYDAKFHRSMQMDSAGEYLYTATALLHDVDRYYEAPGGGLFRHHLPTGRTEKLGIPLPHIYIQSIALDEARGRIYAMHFTPERLSAYDLATGETRDLGPISSGMAMAQGENVCLDNVGRAWVGWHVTRAWQAESGPEAHRLACFDPEADRIVYHKHGLPRRDGTTGHAKVEGLFNLGSELFASGDNGSLYRVDTDTGRGEYLGTPIADRPSRLTSLVMHCDGYAYGVVGRAGHCRLLRVDPRDGAYESGPPVVTAEGDELWQCHDVTITPDGVLFAAENDHPRRPGYLWEISLEQ